MWILCSKVGNHGKETHLALESQIWDSLTDPSMPTTQILDWGNMNN